MARFPTGERLKHGIMNGYRSGLEERIARELDKLGIKYRYEEVKIKYTQPSKSRTYTPDFVLPNGVIVESKGRFLSSDRQKHLMIQKEHPRLDIRFVFANPNTRINKGSPTTYAMWCEKNGFLYAKGSIPLEWLK